MPGPVSVCRARSVRRSHRSPSSNSPVQTTLPASDHQRGRDDGLGAPAVSFGERDRLLAALPGCGERADLGRGGGRLCRPSRGPGRRRNRAGRGSRLPGRAGRSSGPGRRPPGGGVRRPAAPGTTPRAIPRFSSATARRSLPSAMSSSDCPVTGEARNLACSTTPARWPRRRASDSFSAATATRRRRWRSGGVVST